MVRVALLLCLLFVSAVLCDTEHQTPKKAAKGVFVSCKGCRLKRMPEVKRFFMKSVLAGEYGDKLNVQFKRGASPVLVLYDEADAEIERIKVDYMKYDEMHALVQKHGFERVTQEEPAAETAGADEPVQAAKGVFVSCQGCRLKQMPEVRQFFQESVLKGEYGDRLTVQFKGGADPVLYLHDESGTEVGRTPVDYMTTDALHALVQKHGFVRQEQTQPEPAAAAAAADVTAAAAAPASSTNAAVATPADDEEPIKAARGLFVSCSGCRLRRMPEVKRFFKESVLAGEYGDKLDVKYKGGASPVLVLYDEADAEVARIKVDYMKYDEMHALVQKHGFERVTQPAAEETSSAAAATAADSAAKAAIESTLPPLPTDAIADGTISEL